MKPCPANKKLITWLALDALDESSAQKLRVHLETCPGCRQYLAETSRLTGQIAAAAPGESAPGESLGESLPSSENFHRQLMQRIKAEPPVTLWQNALHSLAATILNWRVAVPAMALAIIILVVTMLEPRPQPMNHFQPRPIAIIQPPANHPAAFTPTLAHYRQVADQSLDKLDASLESDSPQASPPAQVCQASATSLNF